jgi:pSer/pThr/pTyr-binding forkhead associated (FHA) protein
LDEPDTQSDQRHALASSKDKPSAAIEHPQTSTTFIGDPGTPKQMARVPALHLEVTHGPSAGKTFVVDEAGAILGRLPECYVHVPDERLSRQHAAVEFRSGGYWLRDLNSRNGTAVNGTLLTAPHLLQSGDSIEVGASLLVVKMEA